LADGNASLAGRVNFKSHLHNGQRVASEYTIQPNATHFVLMQALIPDFGARRTRVSGKNNTSL
jgi:hypothetical protein